MTAKRHHYVPQFYLRYFASDAGQKTPTFWVYDKAGGEPRQQPPVNTAVEGHFYSFETEEGRDDRIEEALARLEAAAKPILDHWLSAGVRPEREEISEIGGFLAFMHTRVPRR